MEYQNDILRRDVQRYRNEKLKNFKSNQKYDSLKLEQVTATQSQQQLKLYNT